MLRTTLYRRVILIALSAAAIVAIGIGFFAASFYSSSIEEEKDSAFEDIQSRLDLSMTMLEAPKAEMLNKGREALLSLARDYGDGAELAAWSQERLKAKASSLGVDDIYVIDSRRVIVATSLTVDLGLNFSKFDPAFVSFLDEVKGKGRVYDQSFSTAMRTGDVKTYQYLGPVGSDYLIEVSSNIERGFADAHSGLAYSGFMDLLFRPFFNRREGRMIRKLDVIFKDGGSYWSLVRPGEKRNVDPALIEQAVRDGESMARSGNLAYCYRPADYGNQGGNYKSPVLAEVVVDLSSLQSFGLLSFFISLAACAAAGILSLAAARSFFDRSIVARVESLQVAMDKVACGERGVSFDIGGDDELSSIGKAIETMLSEVRATEESLRNARTAEALGLMAGGLAHDINNLLTGAVGAASLLRNRLEEEGSVPPDEIRSSLKLIESTGEKGEILVRDLLALARTDKIALKPVDLKALASETVDFLKASAPPSVTIGLELPEGEAFVMGVAEDLRRVLINLCRNGIQAMTDMCPPEVRRGGRLGIKLARLDPDMPESGKTAATEGWWTISICDEGVGIPPEVQQRLFTPFFTTKPRRGGSGLGLSASKAIMEAHGGRIEIVPGKDKGTVFTMLLPAMPPASSCGASPPPHTLFPMELDSGRDWRLFLASHNASQGFVPAAKLSALVAAPDSARSPAEFAAAELCSGLAALGLPVRPGTGEEEDGHAAIILDHGEAPSRGPDRRRGFVWRASPSRMEVHGDSEAGLLAGVYDLLAAAGMRWAAPSAPASRVAPAATAGSGAASGAAPSARAAQAAGRRVELAAARGRGGAAPGAVLILGHGSYLGAAPDYLLWAARNGYSGVFFHTTDRALAYGASPLALYEAMRPELAALALRLGLEVEEGGHCLSSLLPRSRFKKEPELFRMRDGERRADSNFCPSNPRSLDIIKAAFGEKVRARPEVDVFHVWPDDLPGGGWCTCPACAGLSPAAQSLRTALALAEVLAGERPDARLSFLAYHDTEDLEAALRGQGMPSNLELLWAPRKRSWARAYGDPDCALNAASAARFESARAAFTAAGGRTVTVFEYWEDAILFKLAVPPLSTVMQGDLAFYAKGVSRIGILLTGDRLPLAPRPNLWLLPRLLAAGGTEAGGTAAEGLMADWCAAVYGPAAPAMLRYWKAFEAAWAIDLDLEPGDCELFIPSPMTRAATEPPADWGDPWMASLERLTEKRSACEPLFSLLREAEAALDEARGLAEAEDAPRTPSDGWLGAVEAEAREYAIAEGILELDCARLSAYHEAAAGQDRAAADIALIARAVLAGVKKAQKAVPDPRARREGDFLLTLFYDLRLSKIMRKARRQPGRFLGEKAALLGLAIKAARVTAVWEKRRAG